MASISFLLNPTSLALVFSLLLLTSHSHALSGKQSFYNFLSLSLSLKNFVTYASCTILALTFIFYLFLVLYSSVTHFIRSLDAGNMLAITRSSNRRLMRYSKSSCLFLFPFLFSFGGANSALLEGAIYNYYYFKSQGVGEEVMWVLFVDARCRTS